MDKAIKKAIEGGYRQDLKEEWQNLEECSEQCRSYKPFGKWLNSYLVILPKEQILLDPLFWQALSEIQKKETGKWVQQNRCYGCGKSNGSDVWENTDWHNLVNHLAEGKDINSFFEELLKCVKDIKQ